MLKRVILLFVILISPCAFAQEKFALVIGNSNYQHTSPLQNPGNDARLIAGTLSQLGFDVMTLYDGTQDEMQDAFYEYGQKAQTAGEDGVGVLYFAGHGAQSQGRNYLIPVDSKFISEADIWRTGVRVADALRYVEIETRKDFPGGRVEYRWTVKGTHIIILDACRDLPVRASRRSVGRGLARMERSNGMMLAFATGPGEVALDGINNSPFAAALATRMRERGLPVEQMFKRIATDVLIATNGDQNPYMESGLTGEDFCFAGCDVREILADEEATALAQALTQNTLQVWREFQARYPSSNSRSLADNRISQLSESSVVDASSAAATTTELPSTPSSEEQTFAKIEATDWDTLSRLALSIWRARRENDDFAPEMPKESYFVFFDLETTAVAPEQVRRLERLASELNAQIQSGAKIRLVSGCETREKSEETCASRAQSVQQVLEDYSVPRSAFMPSFTYGNLRQLELPAGTKADESQLNRYVWIQIT